MTKRLMRIPRRTVLKRFAAGAAVAVITRPAFAVPEAIKIGLVAPQTGPLALFNEEMAYALDHAKKALNNSIKINGTVPCEERFQGGRSRALRPARE
jgi:branched-chain amino acid transport system substrate-binding protein